MTVYNRQFFDVREARLQRAQADHQAQVKRLRQDRSTASPGVTEVVTHTEIMALIGLTDHEITRGTPRAFHPEEVA